MVSECFICGKLSDDMKEIRTCYRFVGHKDICKPCGLIADNIIGDYWGVKKESDKAKLKSFMLRGILVNKEYEKIMFSGYYKG